jgi:hypothetical protein
VPVAERAPLDQLRDVHAEAASGELPGRTVVAVDTNNWDSHVLRTLVSASSSRRPITQSV